MVSTAPNLTEILFAISAQDHIVGVTSDCKIIREARSYTTVGTSVHLFLPRIRSLNPDYVFMLVPLQESLVPKLTENGFKVIAFPGQSVDGLIWTVREIGRLLGKVAEAEKLALKLEGQKKRALDSKPGKSVRVFAELSYNPLYTVGWDTYLNELITLAGGVNIFGEKRGTFVKVSEEEVVRRNPQVILLLHRGENPNLIWKRPGWQTTDAANGDRVYLVPDVNLLTLPGPRFFEAVEYLRNCFFGKR